MPWEYEPDEKPKRKHGWNRDEAGFIEVHGVPVGKCPQGMNLSDAKELLNDGIPFPANTGPGHPPRRIYVVQEGVLYRAVPTVPGRSYHGFPELPTEFSRMPRQFQALIMERARELECEEELIKWLAS